MDKSVENLNIIGEHEGISFLVDLYYTRCIIPFILLNPKNMRWIYPDKTRCINPYQPWHHQTQSGPVSLTTGQVTHLPPRGVSDVL